MDFVERQLSRGLAGLRRIPLRVGSGSSNCARERQLPHINLTLTWKRRLVHAAADVCTRPAAGHRNGEPRSESVAGSNPSHRRFGPEYPSAIEVVARWQDGDASVARKDVGRVVEAWARRDRPR